MSNTITLQLSYDSSFIDFVVHKNHSDDPDKITSVDVKLSLLSSGNSYSINQDINAGNFVTLRNYLLPWKWIGTDNPPTHIRIYKITNGKIPKPLEWIDVKIEDPQAVDSTDCSMIQNYFEKSLVSQLRTPDHIKLTINKEEAEIINVDENYTVNTVENKSQAIIAQMAQKLTPFNEKLSFLFLISRELSTENELRFFTPSEDKKISFLCFPVTPANDNSIWYPKPDFLGENNGNYWIEYNIPELLNRNHISCCAFTKATDYPKSDYPPLPQPTFDAEPVIPVNDTVILRRDGKFNGKVKIEVEQDNDWKIGFTDVLAALLDIRDFIFCGTPENKKFKVPIDFVREINVVKSYLLSPFIHLSDCFPAIQKKYLDFEIANGNGSQDKIADTIKLVNETFKDFYEKEDSYIKKETEKEKLLSSILNLIPYSLEINEGFGSQEEIESYKLYNKLADEKVVQTLISILLQFDYKMDLLPIKGKEEYYSLGTDGSEIWINQIKEEGKDIPGPMKKVKLLNIYSLNIYQDFFRFLLDNASTDDDIPLLKYLINDLKDFSPDTILQQIPLLINAVYNSKNESPFSPIKNVRSYDIKFNTIVEDVLINYLKDEITRLTAEPKTPSTEQLPIRIQIGKPNQLAPKKDEESDDLADELSGYVLLSTRSQAVNDSSKYKSWKYHNWGKAKLSTGDDKLTTPFLVPSYLPEQNDVQQLFLEISNESASLVANLEGLGKDDFIAEGSEKNKAPTIDFFLPDNNNSNNPYALRYGYYYNFAAFAVMNSGVLPEPLREGDVLNQFKKDITGDISEFTKTFHFLRTKAVSPPSVIIKDPDDKTTHYPKDYPKELNPLYHELFGVNEDKITKDSTGDKKRTDLKAPIILGEKFNKEFSIKIKKPRTDFWDCYSFDWKEFNGNNINANKYKIKDESKNIEEFLDPSVADSIWMKVEVLNSLNSSDAANLIQPQTIEYNSNHEIQLNIKWGENDSFINNTLTLSQGKIYKISFFNLIDEKYFGKDGENPTRECRFDLKRNFIPDREEQERDGLVMIAENKGTGDERSINCYKVSGEHLIFETAYQNTYSDDPNKNLWKALDFNEELVSEAVQMSDSVKLILNSGRYKSYSRIKVQHQKLDWQGRQPNINFAELGTIINPDPDKRMPDDTLTITKAMELDAWWNSERPHDTSVISYAKILASREGKDNILHEYKNILDNHAMLLKYAVTLYNRYESLGGPYDKDIITSKIKLDNEERADKKGTFYPWKFYLKKSRREEQLPAPSVRFYIPLTGSIKEANETSLLNIADVMLVMDDVWYREAGLAQKFTLGIKNTAYKITSESGDLLELKQYPEAGFDVTLSEAATKPHKVSRKEEDASAIITDDIEDFILVDDQYITGPLGFTFDFVATNPKVNSTSFVISGNGLASYIRNDYKDKNDPFYPMFKLAVRSEISPALHTMNEEPGLKPEEKEKWIRKMTSKWSGAQWVQFLKAVDSFVPDQWRSDVRKNGFVNISKPPRLEDFNLFGTTFLQYHNWYIILSTIESNIGGLPVERYYDTYRIAQDNPVSVHENKEMKHFPEGYARIMVVRKSNDFENGVKRDNIWDELFGKKENDDEKSKIKNDNILAMPIITERIPVKFKS